MGGGRVWGSPLPPLSLCQSPSSCIYPPTYPSPHPTAYVQLLALWLASLPVELFGGGRIIRPLQRYLTGLASQV